MDGIDGWYDIFNYEFNHFNSRNNLNYVTEELINPYRYSFARLFFFEMLDVPEKIRTMLASTFH